MSGIGNSIRLASQVLVVAPLMIGCSDEKPVRSAGSAGSATSGAATTGSAGSTGTSVTTGSGAGGASTTGSGGASTAAAGGTTGSAGSATGGTAGSGGAGGQPCVVPTGPYPMKLPFAVDQYFVASGWMQPALIHQDTTCVYSVTAADDGGSPADEAGVDAGVTDAAGPDAAAGDATIDAPSVPPRGDASVLPGSKCWTITYSPTTPGDWAGVDWQYPVNNWGASDGLVIPAGATKVSFVAWGDVGGEKVSFNVGYGPTSTDLFGASLADRFLTTTPTTYSIDVSGIAYTCSSVRMGFGWVAGGGTQITFHVADIRWE